MNTLPPPFGPPSSNTQFNWKEILSFCISALTACLAAYGAFALGEKLDDYMYRWSSWLALVVFVVGGYQMVRGVGAMQADREREERKQKELEERSKRLLEGSLDEQEK